MPTRSGERVVQQPVGLLAVGACAQVIGAVVVNGVDVRLAHELLELDQMRALAGGGVDLLLAEHDVLPLADLIALGHLLVRNLFALLGADPLLLDPGPILRVHLMEVHALVLGRRVHLDGHGGEAEGDRAVPD